MPDSPPDNSRKRASFDRDSVKNTLIVAISLSLVCSILVATAAVLLKPVQQRNEERFRRQIVLEVAGLIEPGADIDALFERIEPRVVNLETGEYVDSIDASDFDPAAAARDPATSIAIRPESDLANLRRRSTYARVYLVKSGRVIEQIILPVYGSGLWSTMYGYLALASDGTTVTGLRFYDHAETPGLGDQVESPQWRAAWVGKKVYGPDGKPSIEVIRGPVQSADAVHQIDGLSGATLTGRGVTNLVQYWTGSDGFGPYLKNFWPANEASK